MNICQSTKVLSEILDPINKLICSNCPEAEEGSVVDGHAFATKEAGCCSLCAKYGGHQYFKDKELMVKLGFDKKYGFFDPLLKKCRLSREDRSMTCQHYICSRLEKVIPKKKILEIRKHVLNIEKCRIEIEKREKRRKEVL